MGNGRGLPDTSLLLSLSEVLEVSADELLHGELNNNNAFNRENRYSSEKKTFIYFIITIIPTIIWILYISFLLFINQNIGGESEDMPVFDIQNHILISLIFLSVFIFTYYLLFVTDYIRSKNKNIFKKILFIFVGYSLTLVIYPFMLIYMIGRFINELKIYRNERL